MSLRSYNGHIDISYFGGVNPNIDADLVDMMGQKGYNVIRKNVNHVRSMRTIIFVNDDVSLEEDLQVKEIKEASKPKLKPQEPIKPEPESVEEELAESEETDELDEDEIEYVDQDIDNKEVDYIDPDEIKYE